MNEYCKDLKIQFKRLKGQIDGIEKMISEGRDPIEIIQQITASRSALSSFAVKLLSKESQKCLSEKKDSLKLEKFQKLVLNFFRIN